MRSATGTLCRTMNSKPGKPDILAQTHKLPIFSKQRKHTQRFTRMVEPYMPKPENCPPRNRETPNFPKPAQAFQLQSGRIIAWAEIPQGYSRDSRVPGMGPSFGPLVVSLLYTRKEGPILRIPKRRVRRLWHGAWPLRKG